MYLAEVSVRRELFLCHIKPGISPPMDPLLELMLPTVNAWSSLLCFIDYVVLKNTGDLLDGNSPLRY